MQLIFGTHNQNKVEEIAKILPSGYIIKSLTDLNFNSEIEESGTTLEENALIKATTIFNIFKKDCFADDTGLMVNALGGRPGVFSARYAGNKKIAKDNTNKTIEAGKVGYNWLIRPQLLWLVDKAEYKERKIIKNCLVNRGHSILND